MQEKRFTREEFYDLVWSKPARKLAPELGISDAAITKICRRYRIPKPGIGDWNLMSAGHRVTKPKLPALKAGERNHIVIWATEKEDRIPPPTLSEDLIQLIKSEKLPENRIVADPDQEITYAVLRKTAKLLKNAAADMYGRLAVSLYNKERLPIGLDVSADSLQRSLGLLNALFQALEQRGHKVRTVNNYVFLVVMGEHVSIYLKEGTIQKMVREHERSEYSYRKYKYSPSGKLKLSLSSEAERTRNSWTDKPGAPLEDQLNEIVMGILTHAALAPSSRAARLERERERDNQRMERERKEREDQQRRFVFAKRKQSLEHELEAWNKCQNVRVFLTQCEVYFKDNGSVDPISVEQRWLLWAKKFADSLDPIKNGRLQLIVSKFDEPGYY
jgi:hypothetical protein